MSGKYSSQINLVAGYGSCHIPSAPGVHKLDCVMWQPQGNWLDGLSQSFLGTTPQLSDTTIVHSCANRYGLTTKTAGVVDIEVQVLHTGFTQRGGVFEAEDI